MASLDLQPDLRLMLVQAGVFATNLFVVKYFFISPYLALKNARSRQTEGAQKQAQTFSDEGDSIEKEIDKRLKEAFESAKTTRKIIQQKADQEYKSIVDQARKRADEHVLQVGTEIQLALKQERKKLASESPLLTGFLYSLLFGKDGV